MPLWPGGASPFYPGSFGVGGSQTITGTLTVGGATTIGGALLVSTSISNNSGNLSLNGSNLILTGSGNQGIVVDNNGQVTFSLARNNVGASVNFKSLTELLTIAAAATTDTTMQLPAGALIVAVEVRVNTVIPTAATFTVTGAGSATTFSTAAVAVAATTTDKGTAAGVFYNATAQSIRITPSLTPGAATGVVRIVVYYFEATPPSA